MRGDKQNNKRPGGQHKGAEFPYLLRIQSAPPFSAPTIQKRNSPLLHCWNSSKMLKKKLTWVEKIHFGIFVESEFPGDFRFFANQGWHRWVEGDESVLVFRELRRRSGDDVLRRTLCRVLPVAVYLLPAASRSRLRAHPVPMPLFSLFAGVRCCGRRALALTCRANTHTSVRFEADVFPGSSRFPASRKSIMLLYSLSPLNLSVWIG